MITAAPKVPTRRQLILARLAVAQAKLDAARRAQSEAMAEIALAKAALRVEDRRLISR